MIWIVLVILLTPSSLYAMNIDEVGKKGFGPGKQDWGYVLVRPAAHMFWWLYYVNPPAMNSSIHFDVYTRPLIIWLQGGLGVSATSFGNFYELGPLDIDLKPRNYTWVSDYNILFIDNPVGTGFSFVDNNTAMAENNTQIAQDLLECIKSFLESVPKFKNVPTYIVAESYGGKIAVEFALLWFRAQSTTNITSKLKGIAIGDSPISFSKVVRSIPAYLLNMGLVDKTDFRKIKRFGDRIKTDVIRKEWADAYTNYKNMWNIIYDVTDNIDVYNILTPQNTSKESYCRYNFSHTQQQQQQKSINVSNIIQKLMENNVKKALNLSSTYNLMSSLVVVKLTNDFMKPVHHIVEKLLMETDLKIFVYTGQLDMVIPPSSTLAWMRKLKWKNALSWRTAPRFTLIINNVIEGFVKEFEKLKFFLIVRAGHLVSRDNPYALKAIIKDLTTDLPKD